MGIRILLPLKAPSVNSLYGLLARGSRVQFFLKPEGRRFKAKAKLFMRPEKLDLNHLYEMVIKVYDDWYYKNGSVRRLDIMNLDKIICDAVAEKYLDGKDELVFKRTIEKIQGKAKIEIELNLYIPGSAHTASSLNPQAGVQGSRRRGS